MKAVWKLGRHSVCLSLPPFKVTIPPSNGAMQQDKLPTRALLIGAKGLNGVHLEKVSDDP